MIKASACSVYQYVYHMRRYFGKAKGSDSDIFPVYGFLAMVDYLYHYQGLGHTGTKAGAGVTDDSE